MKAGDLKKTIANWPDDADVLVRGFATGDVMAVGSANHSDHGYINLNGQFIDTGNLSRRLPPGYMVKLSEQEFQDRIMLLTKPR